MYANKLFEIGIIFFICYVFLGEFSAVASNPMRSLILMLMINPNKDQYQRLVQKTKIDQNQKLQMVVILP
jgi:hypothetical protein